MGSLFRRENCLTAERCNHNRPTRKLRRPGSWRQLPVVPRGSDGHVSCAV